MIRFSIFIFILTFIFSCNRRVKLTEEKPLVAKKLLTLSKSSCFGKCAVYKISLFQDGLLILEGKANIDKLGVYHSSLNAVELSKISNKANQLNWTSYKHSYMKNIADLPVSTLIYKNPKDSTEVKIESNSSLPDELETIHTELSNLLQTQTWILAIKDNQLKSKDIITNELQIDMDTLQNYMNLEKMFAHYNLKSIKRISEYMNFYLFTFDDTKIAPTEMVVLLRRVKGVRLVNFNKKLSPREEN